MTPDINFYFATASMFFFAMVLVAYTTVRIWNDWISFKRAELDNIRQDNQPTSPNTTSRIEVADLKERVRKLEAIAAGIDL